MSRSRAWFCTWNNFPEDWQAIIKGCGAVDYSAQKEKGKDAEGEHIQFAVKFENARQFTAVQELFKGAHIEPAKDWIKVKNYCMKEDTRVEKGIIHKPNQICRDPLEGKELRPVQKQIMDIINSESEDRWIHWFYDPDGCIGKTTIAKSVCINDKSAICLSGKASDMKYGVMSMVSAGRPPKTVFIALTRSVESFVSYQGIEEVKDGFFFNTKYECGMCILENPHIIVLSNFYPEKTTMTPDRWKIWNCQGKDKKAVLEGEDKNKEETEPVNARGSGGMPVSVNTRYHAGYDDEDNILSERVDAIMKTFSEEDIEAFNDML